MCGQSRFVRMGIGGGDMHAQVHAARPRVNETSCDLHDVADDDRAIEPDAADIGGDDLAASPVGAAYISSVVHPMHGASTVDLAAPVDVGRGREEPQSGLVCGAGWGVLLVGHGFNDACPQRYPGPGLAGSLQIADRLGYPPIDLDPPAGG